MAIDDDVLGVLPVAYRAVHDRAREVLHADGRIRAVWLGGSLARGAADAASDLDLLVTVSDAGHEDVAASWRTWLAAITPTVHAEELPFAPGSFHAITPDFVRLDVVLEPVSSLPTTFFRSRRVVFDRDGLAAVVPAPAPQPGPSADAVRALVVEYFRVSMLEVVLVRDDWLLAREHLHHVASLAYRLFLEANAPLPPMGVKQWGTRLTPAQREALASIPTSATDVEELRRAHLAAAAVVLTNAEALARRLGFDWPHDLEQAAAAHVREVLGIAEPHPRAGQPVV